MNHRLGSSLWNNKVETSVSTKINLDGSGQCSIRTQNRILDHFLFSFARYGRLDLEVEVSGDQIQHHLFEHTGISLGLAVFNALPERSNLVQFSRTSIPMDEAFADVVMDINHTTGGLLFKSKAELIKLSPIHDGVEVFCYIDLIEKMAEYSKINIHVVSLKADDIHHALEVLYKALGLALYQASRIETNPIVRLNKSI